MDEKVVEQEQLKMALQLCGLAITEHK